MSATPASEAGKIEVWKALALAVCAVLATVLGSGIMAWLTFGTQHPSRDEVRVMIAEVSPYLHDKAGITEQLQNTRGRVDALERELREINSSQARMAANMELLLMEVREMRAEWKKARGKDEPQAEGR